MSPFNQDGPYVAHDDPPSGRAFRDASRGACDDRDVCARAYDARRVCVSEGEKENKPN